MAKHNQIGRLGEDIAAKYLEEKGYAIVDRNYNVGVGEIDLVCKKRKILYFVEVKSVSCERVADVSHRTDGYRPEENVHPGKLRKLARAVEVYLAKRGDQEWEFLVAAVYISEVEREARVRLLDNIVL